MFFIGIGSTDGILEAMNQDEMVRDHMHLLVGREIHGQMIQKSQNFLLTVPGLHLTGHSPRLHVRCGKEQSRDGCGRRSP